MYGEGKTRGKVAELRISAATNQACAAIMLPLEASLRAYVKLFLLKNYDDLRRLSSGGVQPNLNLSIVREIAVPMPPEPEQVVIVEEVERRLSVADAVAADVDAQLARSKRLRRSILQRAFEGRLVPPIHGEGQRPHEPTSPQTSFSF